MSKTEYMGVSPSQVSCQTGNYSCHKQSPSGQMHEFGAESVHSEPSEQKHQPDFESLEDEPRETITAVSSQAINENLQPISENVTNDCFTENLEPRPKDVHKSSQTGKCLCSQKDISEQKLEFGSGSLCCEPSEEFQKLGSQLVENELVETCTTGSSCIASEQLGPPGEFVTKSSPIEHLQPPTGDAIKVPSTGQLGSLPEDVDKNSSLEHLETPPENAVKNSSCFGHKDRRTSKSLKKKHMLKSLVNSDRVLRSRSQEKPKAPESSKNLTNVSSGGEENKKKRRKKRRVNRRVADEYSRVRAQVRYFLNRISYEQSLIAAYSGEGWKGLSLEKLKPEKELQRATSEILRRKLKIRDLFQRLDSLCAEGRFPESFFDSEGQIDSEDIFCAKCGFKDLSADNDIILCDGACDRGFHQFCLEPPLLKEDIPPDDEGWLCPGCDCKVDCLDLLNESQGTNLSITDKWEKVFPEAAAGHNHDPNFGLPSDDSDDNDYDPEGPQSDEKDQGDESSSDDSEFTSASDELGTPPNDEQHLGFSSDGSEDDDYDPDAPDLDNNVKLESSSSDFTSDSEDLGVALDDNMSSGKDDGPMPMSPLKGSNRRRSKLGGKKKHSLNSELLSILELDPGQDGSAPVSGKRNVERLDYKKLHDEEYGNVSSHSSDDEDWSDPCLAKEQYGNVSSHSTDDEDWTDAVAPRKRRKSTGEVALESPKGNAPVNKSGSNINDIKQNLKETENTPKRRTHHKSNFEDAKPAKSHEGSSNSGSCSKKSAYRRLGEDVTQRLYKSFKENQYPDRITKEKLAKELDITFRQVSKWFENARWSFNHSSCMDADIAKSSSKKKTSSPQTNKKPLEQGPETRTRDATCNGAQSEDAPKADAAVTKCCSVDARASESATHESSRQKSTTPTSRKRKGKMDHQASDPDSRIEEMQKLPEDVPKAPDMQTGSKIQTRRRKSVA